jgi:hypothetical protein
MTAAAEVKAVRVSAKDAHEGNPSLGVPASAPEFPAAQDGVGGSGWRDRAACVGIGDPEIFFSDRGEHAGRVAKWVCNRTCPVREECLADALRHEVGLDGRWRHGIWGGLNGNQRAALDPTRRPTADWVQIDPARCPWPNQPARSVARHRRLGQELCPPCREWERSHEARAERDERVARLAAEGLTAWHISLVTGEAHGTVRGVLSRLGKADPDPLELVLEREIAVGD